jgi:hypothetical protein
MAEARQRAEWERLATAVCWLVNTNGFIKRSIRPRDVMPPAFRPPKPPPREKTPEEIESENRLAWKALDTFFTQHR